MTIAHEQVDMIVGKKADAEFLKEVKDLAMQHGEECEMEFDSMTAYHFGPRYLVELEMMMDQTTPLKRSHDMGLQLQDTIEKRFEEKCERCFVHIDYQTRLGEDGRSIDHDRTVPLQKKLCGSDAFLTNAVARNTTSPPRLSR